MACRSQQSFLLLSVTSSCASGESQPPARITRRPTGEPNASNTPWWLTHILLTFSVNERQDSWDHVVLPHVEVMSCLSTRCAHGPPFASSRSRCLTNATLGDIRAWTETNSPTLQPSGGSARARACFMRFEGVSTESSAVIVPNSLLCTASTARVQAWSLGSGIRLYGCDYPTRSLKGHQPPCASNEVFAVLDGPFSDLRRGTR